MPLGQLRRGVKAILQRHLPCPPGSSARLPAIGVALQNEKVAGVRRTATGGNRGNVPDRVPSYHATSHWGVHDTEIHSRVSSCFAVETPVAVEVDLMSRDIGPRVNVALIYLQHHPERVSIPLIPSASCALGSGNV